MSPFNYAENKPISGIDLWGLQYSDAADGKRATEEDNSRWNPLKPVWDFYSSNKNSNKDKVDATLQAVIPEKNLNLGFKILRGNQ